MSQFFRDNRVFEVYQQLGTTILNDPNSLRKLRPWARIAFLTSRSQLTNLVYCLSYSRFSNRNEL